MMILLQKTLESCHTFSLIRLRSGSTISISNLMVTWLECEMVMASGKKIMRSFKCSVCSKYRIRKESSRNFSDRWIVGAKSLRTSNIRDHRKNNQHALAMSLLMKERASSCGQGSLSYAPIVQALNTLSDTEKARLKHKFDIAYLVATESISFFKYPIICKLKRKHGVDIGVSYINERSDRTFVHYIAEKTDKRSLLSGESFDDLATVVEH